MYDLFEEIRNTQSFIDESVRQLREDGKKYAQAEHDYKVALSKKILSERDKGIPVTIISDICRGDEGIAKLRFERDVAEVAYKATQEGINSGKLQLRILDAQLAREWGAAK